MVVNARAPYKLGRVIQFVADNFGEHLEVLAHPLPVFRGNHLEEVIHARRDLKSDAWFSINPVCHKPWSANFF